ncbi:MAG: DUF559 domain-containing protein, partial [Solirubrobacterales bacterium]|nr:DUF559 domain-containing protein [Solirubrobacterales bacterium]
RLAGAQRSSIKRAQLLAAGISRHTVERRAKMGELHRKHRGVYIVGHVARVPMADEWAAVLACGDGALVSHRSAAHLWSFLSEPPSEVEVTLVGRRCRPKDGVRLHTTAWIDQRDVRYKDGIPLTSPARTLIDHAASADDAELGRALAEARVLGLVDDRELEAALERTGSRRGARALRALLRGESERGLTRSEAERVMLELVRDAGLPPPLLNAPLEGYTVDFLWPQSKLVVEVDGYRYHGHRAAFERDRRKDMTLLAAGFRVMRVTWRQLRDQPLLVAAMLASALTDGRSHG